MSITSDSSADPIIPPLSPGSSVSTRLQEEYDELLKYAVLVPTGIHTTTSQTFPLLRHLTDTQDATDHDHTLEGSAADTDRANEADDESERAAHAHQHTSITQNALQQQFINAATQSTKLTGDQIKLQEVRQFVESVRPGSPTDSVTSSRYAENLSQVMYTAGVDPELTRMETLLDQWTLELKRNVLAEYSQCKIKNLELHKQEMLRMKERHNAEKNQLYNEIESMRELLHTYEKSTERKNQVISNLITGIQKQKEKYEMLKTFCDWKVKHNEHKQEAYASNLAHRYFERTLQRRAYRAWHSVIENNWRGRVEKACQAKAQHVCLQLTNEYETTIAELNRELQAAHNRLADLGVEREKYEENMKKAFMRGVCALNMEAMTMFNDNERSGSTPGSSARDSETDHVTHLTQPACAHTGTTLTQQPQSFTIQGTGSIEVPYQPGCSQSTAVPILGMTPADMVPPGGETAGGVPVVHRVITSQTSAGTQSRSFTTGATRKPKTTMSKVTARVDSGLNRGTALAPPMSSVVVERHPPINKETIGQATATYFSSKMKPVPMLHRSGSDTIHVNARSTPHLNTIKVVE